ncbi:unnamed protein product [Protopolystoma xenopodis]|uniref:CHD subfamily II SANT-like domain-containing protein n=1 Tax=Protopolystoma xenopodis TaxID=117903 RepID=A0A3S5BCG1_9PLAT|nr:unnamed protein product [Protopolystoma xenopodis]
MRAATTTKFTSQMPSDIQVDFSRQQTKSSGVSPLTKTELESGSISIRSFNRMQTSNSTLRAWLELAAVLPECLTLDESGFLIIYDLRLHLIYLNFGLPPPGIIPPQDWLPAELLSLPCEQLFAYTCLFMRHLYEPEALDDTVALWSDGLPKEFVNGASVLSRVAMMAMIRKKVSEFEDFNGLVSYVAECRPPQLNGGLFSASSPLPEFLS